MAADGLTGVRTNTGAYCRARQRLNVRGSGSLPVVARSSAKAIALCFTDIASTFNEIFKIDYKMAVRTTLPAVCMKRTS